MRELTKSELKLFEQLVSAPQRALKKALASFLKSKYTNITHTKDYLYAEGDIPIALVAHMDTVFTKLPTEIYYDRKKNVIWSPQGLGADDRAGVFAICQIIKAGYRPHIIFTTDEEKGGLGAYQLAGQQCPFGDLRYMIELDRRGSDDCVFYDCINQDFIQYIEKFGFKENWGTFSDISYLAPDWGVSAVNLSIGYKDEHSTSETLHIDWLLRTIERVKTMLDEEEIPYFEFIENPYNYAWLSKYYSNGGYYGTQSKNVNPLPGQVACPNCRSVWDVEDTYPVEVGEDTYDDYCLNCIALDKVKWCHYCGNPFIPDAGQSDTCCRQCEGTYGYYDRNKEGAV